MGTQVTYAPNLPPIPSEYIEPYAQRFLMMQLESVYAGILTPKEAKEYIKGAEYFISCFGDLHAQIAVSNEYHKFMILPDKEMIDISKKVFNK